MASCNCIIETEMALQEQYQGEMGVARSAIKWVRLRNKELGFLFGEYEISIRGRRGRPRDTIMFRYCPFCGRSYSEVFDRLISRLENEPSEDENFSTETPKCTLRNRLKKTLIAIANRL